MCLVSNIGDYWRQTNPWIDKVPSTSPNSLPNSQDFTQYFQTISRKEFDDLVKEVQELRKLLEAAVKYDQVTNQPHCETEDKVAIIKAVAKALGVDMRDILD